MQYITMINNQKCLEWKINGTQGALFSLLYEANSWAKEVIIDNKVYYFISRNLILKELPLFFEKADTVYRNLKVLKEKGLIEYVKQGQKDLIRITEKGKKWNFKESQKSEKDSEINPIKNENSEKYPNKLGNKSEKNSEINPTNQDTIYYQDTILSNKEDVVVNNIENNNNIFFDKFSEIKNKTEKVLKEMYPNQNIEPAISANLNEIKRIINNNNKQFYFETLEKIKCNSYFREQVKIRKLGQFALWLFKYDNFLKISTGAYDDYDIQTEIQETQEEIRWNWNG